MKKRVFVVIRVNESMLNSEGLVCVFKRYKHAHDFIKRKNAEQSEFVFKIRSCDLIDDSHNYEIKESKLIDCDCNEIE